MDGPDNCADPPLPIYLLANVEVRRMRCRGVAVLDLRCAKSWPASIMPSLALAVRPFIAGWRVSLRTSRETVDCSECKTVNWKMQRGLGESSTVGGSYMVRAFRGRNGLENGEQRPHSIQGWTLRGSEEERYMGGWFVLLLDASLVQVRAFLIKCLLASEPAPQATPLTCPFPCYPRLLLPLC